MTAPPEPAPGRPVPPRLLAVATDADSRKAIAMAAAARGWTAPEVLEGGLEAAHAALLAGPPPALLVIDLSAARAPLAAVDALADLCPAGTGVIAIGIQNDVGLFRGLRRLGVADYLLKPVSRDSIGEAIDALSGDCLPRAPLAPARRARVAALLGSRGGAGTSALAAALALQLVRDGQSTVLLDLDIQGGSLALDLAAQPTPALADLLQSPDRVDPLVVEQALFRHPLGFAMLAVDAPAEQALAIEGDALLALVAAAAQGADALVIDCPRWLDRPRRAVLRMADRVAVISPPTLAGLRDTQRMAALLAGLRAGQAPLLAVNRATAFAAGLARGDFEAGLGSRLVAWIGEDAPAARHAGDHAATLLCRGGRDIARGIAALRDGLFAPPAPVARPRALLARLGVGRAA